MSNAQGLGTYFADMYRREDKAGESSREGSLQWRRERKRAQGMRRELMLQCKDVLQVQEVEESEDVRYHDAVVEPSSPKEADEGESQRRGKKKMDKGKGVCTETLQRRAQRCPMAMAREARRDVGSGTARCQTLELSAALARLKIGEDRPRSEEKSEGEGRRQPEPEEDWVLVAEDIDVWDFTDEVGKDSDIQHMDKDYTRLAPSYRAVNTANLTCDIHQLTDLESSKKND
ncbi:hypothetical protein V8C37DRAFT_402564 [Trichoderma ceciliae]